MNTGSHKHEAVEFESFESLGLDSPALPFRPVRLWVFVITGFLQSRGTRSRMIALWKQAHDVLNHPEIVVALRHWNCDWEAEAEFVYRLSSTRTRVVTFAYSYGAGWGVPQLAEHLAGRGVDVTRAILSDPVHRHPSILCRWTSLFPGLIPVSIPENVHHVESYRQSMNWPRAHRLIAEGNLTTITKPIDLGVPHQSMDDHPTFIGRCLEEVQALALEENLNKGHRET